MLRQNKEHARSSENKPIQKVSKQETWNSILGNKDFARMVTRYLSASEINLLYALICKDANTAYLKLVEPESNDINYIHEFRIKIMQDSE